MVKMHKVYFVTALLFVMLSLFTSCDNKPKHEHTFEARFEQSETHHYHKSTCGCEDLKDKYGEHEFKVRSIKPATCKDGEEISFCKVCDYKKTVILPGTHDWDAGTIVKEATCVDDGEKLFKCSKCTETYTEILPANDKHTFGSWMKTTPPDYGIAGVETRECSVCHTTENRPIDPLLAKDGDIAINLILNKTYDSKAITIANSDIVRKKEGNTLSLSDSEKVIIEFRKESEPDESYTEQAPKDAGSYTVRVRVEANAEWNEAQCITPFKIERAKLSGTFIHPEPREYESALVSFPDLELKASDGVGVQGDDVVKITNIKSEQKDVGENVSASYDVGAEYLNNYQLDNLVFKVNITPAPLYGITGSKPYDGNNEVTIFPDASNGVKGADNIVLKVQMSSPDVTASLKGNTKILQDGKVTNNYKGISFSWEGVRILPAVLPEFNLQGATYKAETDANDIVCFNIETKERVKLKIFPYNQNLHGNIDWGSFEIYSANVSEKDLLTIFEESVSSIDGNKFIAVFDAGGNYTFQGLSDNVTSFEDLTKIGTIEISSIELKRIVAKKDYDGSPIISMKLDEKYGVINNDSVSIDITMSSKDVDDSKYVSHAVKLNGKSTTKYVVSSDKDSIWAEINPKVLNFISNNKDDSYLITPYIEKNGTPLKERTYVFGERNGVVPGESVTVKCADRYSWAKSSRVPMEKENVQIVGDSNYKIGKMPKDIVVRSADISNDKDFKTIPSTSQGTADNSRGSNSSLFGFRYYADSMTQTTDFEIKVTKVVGSSDPVKIGVTLNDGKNLYCKDNNTCIYDGRKGNTNSLYIFFEVPKGEIWKVEVTKKTT